MKLFTWFAAVALILLLWGCEGVSNAELIRGSGTVVTEHRAVQGVRGAGLAMMGELEITQGDQESLRVEAEDNLLPYIETSVWNGLLTIRTRPNTRIMTTKPVRFYLTTQNLDTLSTSSNGSISIPSLQADRVSTNISSNGNIHLGNLNANNLQVNISSNGDVTIDKGDVKQQTANLTSSGEYKAGDLRSQAADMRLSSNGGATIWVTDRLKASLTSSANVRYYGSPVITPSTPSSGRLISLGEK